MEYPRVYDQAMRLLAVLENADGVGYCLKDNDLSTAKLSLPAPDPKNQYMAAHNIVRLWDGDEELGLFRIVGAPEDTNALGGWTEYELEHVMATLVDDVLFGYHEIGGPGIYTRDVAEYILARQETARWQLGRCDFSDQYAYKFENTNLLSALFSLGNALAEPYEYIFDTGTTPWTINIVRADAETGCEMRYRRNMQEITRTMDATALATRLFLLGYGEGVNQLTIRSVNGGLPYLDADTQGVWGVKSSVCVDTTIEDAALLKARGLAVLEELKNPYMAYKATAVDLYRLTGLRWDKYMPGKLVHVIDEDKGIDFTARIVSKSKDDVYGDPGAVEVEIANRVRDIADSINRIAERQGISELYSQGATNLYSQQYADNADANHPAVMRFYVPRGCVRINSVMLSWNLSSFRAYETGAASGGGSTQTSTSTTQETKTTTAGGSSSPTSEAGGGTTVTEPQHSIAGVTSGPKDSTGLLSKNYTAGATDTQGNDRSNTGVGGRHSHTFSHRHYGASHTHSLNSHTHSIGSHTHTVENHRHSLNSHSHTGPSHKHDVYVNSLGKATTESAGTGNTGGPSTTYTGYSNPDTDAASGTTGVSTGSTGSGGIEIGGAPVNAQGEASTSTSEADNHTHGIAHVHNMEHTHSVEVVVPALEINIPAHSHTVNIGSHQHSVTIDGHSHSVDIPSHTHGIVYGIYEGGSARGVTLRVDGGDVPAQAVSANEMDVVAYLSKDSDGRITRGAWHTIEIVPDGLTRIEANLFVQAFVQSVGGGDY